MKDKLELFLHGQYANYDGNLEKSKTRMPQDLRRMSIFRDLYGFVAPFALRKIRDHYKRICGQPTAIEPCTGIFTRTMGLPCAHRIQERLYDRAGDGVLKLEDIHRHWLYTKPPRATTTRAEEQENHTMGDHQGDEDIEVQGTPSPDMPPPPRQILQIQEPAIVKAKGRPRGSHNQLWARAAPPRPTASQRRRRQAFESSTQREPSNFELTPSLPSSQVPDSQPQRQRGGRQQGGRGGRGGARGGAAEGQNAGVPAFYMGSFQM